MIIAPHALTACFIASYLRASPLRWRIVGGMRGMFFLVFLLSFMSHFILDALPHWDYYISKSIPSVSIGNIIFDLVIFGAMMVYIFYKPLIPIFEAVLNPSRYRKEARLRQETISLLCLLLSASFFSLLPDILKNTGQLLGMPSLLFLESIHIYLHSSIKLDPAVGLFMYFLYFGSILFIFLNRIMSNQKLNLIDRLQSELKLELNIEEIEMEEKIEMKD